MLDLKSIILTTLVLSSTLVAQDKTAEAEAPKDAVISETIVVIGDPEDVPLTDTVGSLDVLTAKEIKYEHVDDTLELFSKIPGVYLSRYNQGVINTDIAIRGFAGDGSSPHGKLLIDGIPSNYHNGYNELDQLFPFNISSIAVFKGTSDPRYGLNNVAGNYNVSTRQDEAREIEMTLGSFNTQELQGYWGIVDDNFKHSYTAGIRDNEGYRDNTDLTKYALSGSWQWDFNESTNLRFIARHAHYDGDAPGYLDKQTASDHPKRSEDYANQDGGEKETTHFSLHWTQGLSDDLDWKLKLYWQRYERERWVRFSEAGSLQNRYDEQDHMGVISTLDWYLNDDWTLTWGLDYEYQDVLEQRFATIGNTRTRGTATRDREYDFGVLGNYLKIAHRFSEKFRWNAAIRVDKIYGDFEDEMTGQDRDIYDFGMIVQPKLNLLYSLTNSTLLFANAGRSFQHPFGASAYTAGDRSDRDVSINDGWEAGMQWNYKTDFTVRLSYWQQKASDEYVTVDGDQKNVGETFRDGIDLSFSGQINEKWSYWGSYTYINSEIKKTSDTAADTEGNELRSIPDFTASLGVGYNWTKKLTTRLFFDLQGDYYVNEANEGGKFGDFAILNFSADYDLGWGTVKLQVNNLTDEQNEYVYDFSSDASSTIHSPGDGINGSVSLNIPF
ncbi:MAG: TonB-dependent receptor [Lentisphaeraceae bacterium]|nr:TonB-dependent receptor [Lentisphaeraceae bacterium]